MEAIFRRKILEEIASNHAMHPIQVSRWKMQLLEGASHLPGKGLPAIGLVCMDLQEFYGRLMEHRATINLLHEAVDVGVKHFDPAKLYGIGGANETLLGEAFSDRCDRAFIASKFGPTRDFQTGEFTGLALPR